MSSFLKTSFIHDETAPSESLVLLLKRSFSRQHHLHFFLVFSVPRPSARIVCFALGLQRCTRGRPGLLQATSWWGHVRPCPCPGRLGSGLRSISARLELIFRGLSSDRAGRLRSIRTSKVSSKSISFFVENVRFVIFHPKLALPPPPVSKCVTFRKKLRTYEMLPKEPSTARNGGQQLHLHKNPTKGNRRNKRKD